MKLNVTDGIIDDLLPLDSKSLKGGTVSFYGIRKCFEDGIFGVYDNKHLFVSFPLDDSFIASIAKMPRDKRTVLDSSSLSYHVDSVIELELVEAILDVVAEAHDTEAEDWSYCVGFSDSSPPSIVFVFMPPDDGIRTPEEFVLSLITQTREVGPVVRFEFDRR